MKPFVTDPHDELAVPDRLLGADLECEPTARVALLAVAAGIVGNLALRSGVVGAAGFLAVCAMAGALLASGQVRNHEARIAIALAAVFGSFLLFRTSDWLIPFDVLAALGLLCVGASFARGGSIADLPFAAVWRRAWRGFGSLVVAPAFLPARWHHPIDTRGDRTVAVLRGVFLAFPVVFALGALLRSADVLFASVVDLDFDLGDLGPHAIVIVVLSWGALGLLRASATRPVEIEERSVVRLGRTEASIVLGAVVGLFAVFTVGQVVVALGGGRHVIDTAGLTYAEYARSGFFQLLWVAGLTLAGLVLLRSVVDREDRRLLFLSEAVVVLTITIVFVAIRRLDLYADEYGLTMLRLYSALFAAWIGAVLLLFGLWLAGFGGGRAWFPAASVATGLVILFGLNVVNPEAVVVKNVLSRPDATLADLDPSELSDDAAPLIADAILAGDPDPRAREWLCTEPESEATGWAAANLSRANADDARQAAC